MGNGYIFKLFKKVTTKSATDRPLHYMAWWKINIYVFNIKKKDL